MGANESTLSTQVSSLADELNNIEEKLSSFHDLHLHSETPHHNQPNPNPNPNPNPPTNHSLEDTKCFLFGASLTLGPAKLLIGPVLGKVTEDSANILLEAERDCKLTLHLCLFTEECPSGRHVFSTNVRLFRKRPKVVRISGRLQKDRRYRICFSGLTHSEALARTASFKTLSDHRPISIVAVSSAAPVNHRGKLPNPWDPIHHRVESGQVDILVHLGGQVDMKQLLSRSAILLRGRGDREEDLQLDKFDKRQRALLEGEIEEKMREEYRRTWSMSPLREILGSCSNFMLWSEGEVQLFDARLDREECLKRRELLYPPLLLRIARKLYEEYQCALWTDEDREDEDDEHQNADETNSGNQSLRHRGFVLLTPKIGFFLLNLTGARVDDDGGALPFPEGGLVHKAHLDHMAQTLQAHTNLKYLVVLSDRPVMSAPSDVLTEKMLELQAAVCTEGCRLQEQWNANEEDLERLLTILFGWKSGAEVLLLCGSGRLKTFDYGCETTISNSTSPNRRIIKQMTASPMFTTLESLDIEMPRNFELANGCAVHHSVSSLSAKKFVSANVAAFQSGKTELTLGLYATDGHRPAELLVGPVIGKVSSNEAILLLETNQNAFVTCVVHDTFTQDTKERTQLFEARKASTVWFTTLKPERMYTVTLRGLAMPPDLVVATFKTMPEAVHSKNDIPHSLDFIIVNSTTQECLPSYNSWGKVKEAREPDGVLLDLGGQVDLEIVAKDLQRVVGSIRSQTLQSTQSTRAALEEAICEAYRTSWNQPDKQRVLRSGSNLLLPCESDVTPPQCFLGNEDLRSYYDTIRACAVKVAHRYVLSLHGGGDTEISPLRVLGPLGFLFLDLFSAAPKPRGVLLSNADWQAIENVLQTTDVKNLIVVSECAMVDDIPVDANAQKPLDARRRRSWSSHKSECVHLLELLFAWKALQSGRQVLIATGSVEHGFSTTVTLEEAGMELTQVVAAPLTKHVIPPFSFAHTGSFLSSSNRNGDVTYRFTYKHSAHWKEENAFMVVRMGTGMLTTKVDEAIEKEKTYLSLPIWFIAAVVSGQRSFEQRSARRKEAIASRPEKDAENQAITEMKEEHPELDIFPALEKGESEEDVEPPPLIELKWTNLDASIYPTDCKVGLSELDKRFDTKGVMRAVEEQFETHKDEEGVLEEDCVKLLLCFLGEMDESSVGLTDLVQVPLEKTWLEDLAIFTTRFAWESPHEQGLTKEECHALVKVFLALVLIANEFWP